MKESLLNYIEEHLKLQNAWISKGRITNRTWYRKNGKNYLSGVVDRKLREGENERRWAVKYLDSRNTVYRWLPPDRRASYVPTSERLKGEEDKLFRV